MPSTSKSLEESLTPPRPHQVDGDLVSQAARGDRQAFCTLVRVYQDRLFNVCLRIVGDRQTAEDLTQEAFMKAHDSMVRFDGRAAFYTWLYRIAVNLCLSERRSRRTLRLLVNEDGVGAQQAAAIPSPMERADLREQHSLVLAALADLEEEYRVVVVLRDIDSLDYSEIAEILGVPTGTVKSRLHRGRMALRERLKHLMDG